jgi:hypothetical protein
MLFSCLFKARVLQVGNHFSRWTRHGNVRRCIVSDEIHALRQAIEAGDYTQALWLIDEMDEMSRDDKINKIISYMRVLLIHLIKQAVEKRSTRSWEDSIEESLDSIAATNKRRNSGGSYLDDEALAIALTEAWPRALRRASREAFEGIYSAEHLATQVDREALLETALRQIKERQGTIA